jgi:hypothetical protein
MEAIPTEVQARLELCKNPDGTIDLDKFRMMAKTLLSEEGFRQVEDAIIEAAQPDGFTDYIVLSWTSGLKGKAVAVSTVVGGLVIAAGILELAGAVGDVEGIRVLSWAARKLLNQD